jgi:hypothetical protein
VKGLTVPRLAIKANDALARYAGIRVTKVAVPAGRRKAQDGHREAEKPARQPDTGAPPAATTDDPVVASLSPNEIQELIDAGRHPATIERLRQIIGPTLAPAIFFGPLGCGADKLVSALSHHSQVFAPTNLPLTALQVSATRRGLQALADRGIRRRDAENMLWDHLVRDQFARSRKQVAVVSDFGDAFTWGWRRTHEIWPDSIRIHIVRNPSEVVAHCIAERGNSKQTLEWASSGLKEAMAARQMMPGVTLRYEELRADPAAALRTVCDVLGVEPDPGLPMPGGFRELKPFPVEQLPPVALQARSEWGYAA